jgi:hypothetical protein
LGNAGRAPTLRVIALAFALQLRKKHGKTSVRVVEKCPDIPMAVVQYTEQHNETEYTERNTHINNLRKKRSGKGNSNRCG